MSSPWIRGAPHKGFVSAIRLTRAAISALTGGRPTMRPAGARRPVLAEAAPLPPENGVGGHDYEGLPPLGPDPCQPHPEEAIRPAQPGPRNRSLVRGELLVQGEVLQSKLPVAAAEEREESE